MGPRAHSIQAIKEELNTIILLNGHSIEETPYDLLHPLVSSSLNPYHFAVDDY